MTTATHGPGRFPFEYALAALAGAVIVLVVIAIGQWSESQTQPLALTPSDNPSADVASSEASPNGLSDAIADGKLDAGLIPAESPPPAPQEAVPDTVVITGQGSLYDALIAGKFSLDPDTVRYVHGVEEAPVGLWKALADGKLTDATSTIDGSGSSVTEPARETVLVSGHGGLHNALVAGKFTTDFEPDVLYVQYSTEGGLWDAYLSGQLLEGTRTIVDPTVYSRPESHTDTWTGGHQQ